MGEANGPARLLACVTIEVEINDERGQASIVPHEVGQQAVHQIGVEADLRHHLL